MQGFKIGGYQAIKIRVDVECAVGTLDAAKWDMDV
jgi:hypothetical protein